MKPIEVFRKLPAPSTDGAFSVGGAVGAQCRVGRSFAAHPCLLIAVIRDGSSKPRRLEYLRYAPPQKLRVHASDGTERVEELAVIECQSPDGAVHEAFFRMADALLVGGLLTEATLESRLDGFVDLFRSLARPGDRTVQGLWAELAMILWSQDPARAISAWHSSPRALHDFAGGIERLEVKSTCQPLREHAFALDQLITPPGGHVVVASFLLDETDAGESVADLTTRIDARISTLPESRRRLETVVAQSLGRGWREAADVRFDLEAARTKLRFYDAHSVPCVALPIPEEVKHVDLIVDLSRSSCLPLGNARRLSDFFEAVLSADA